MSPEPTPYESPQIEEIETTGDLHATSPGGTQTT